MRPKRLTLIGKRHRIEWDCDLREGDDVLISGYFHLSKKLIQIAGGQTHDDERETLLHEILHALEVQMDAEIPEPKLRQLAVGLYAALKDNPKLVTYLLEEELDDAELADRIEGLGGSARNTGSDSVGSDVRNS